MIVGNPILGVDLQHPVQSEERLFEPPVQVQRPSEASPRGSILGEILQHPAVREGRLLVTAILLQSAPPDPGHPRVTTTNRLGPPEELVRRLDVPLPQGRPGHVQRTVDSLRLERRHPLERLQCRTRVALPEEGDPVVVVSGPLGRLCRLDGPGGPGFRQVDLELHLIGGDLGDRKVRDIRESPEPLRILVERELRIAPIELAPQEPRPQGQLLPRHLRRYREFEVADVGRSGPDDVGGGGDVDVGRVASVDRVPATVQNDRLVDVRHRIEVAVLAHRAADGQHVALPVQQAELEPPLVGVVGSAGEGVPHALVAHDHVHGDPFAGEKHRRAPIDGHRGFPRARRPEREDVHAQLLIPQEGLGPSDRLLVPPDERKRRVHGEEAVRAHHAALGRHVPPGCRFERHMAVLADAPLRRQVEGSRGVQ